MMSNTTLTDNERKLIDIVRTADDSEKAIVVAVDIIIAFLKEYNIALNN